MMTKTAPKVNVLLFLGFAVLFGFAFLRVYIRVQSTLTGYAIGKLKASESQLLQERSELQMNYAKLTTRDHLLYIIDTQKPKADPETLAAK